MEFDFEDNIVVTTSIDDTKQMTTLVRKKDDDRFKLLVEFKIELEDLSMEEVKRVVNASSYLLSKI